MVCIDKIAGLEPEPIAADRIPACTYSHPQVAHVGLTEQQARDAGRPVRVGKFPFAANGKAIALGETDGFVKVVFDADSGELIGAHMVGDEVTERSEEHTSELQSLMRISYAVFCLKKKK